MGFDLVGGFMSLMCFIWVLGIVTSIFWIRMLIHALTYERRTEDKLLWFLVIFFLHFVGAAIYYIVRRSARSGSVS
jgi:hypothetical protein